ncbi:hypothetical protein EIKCOROL_02230 [Eikenella corrodens ATCC 23834]|uniref:Uncharacterized protein n=1 Tax=Eikenella corrodens ATCC 23834 TaxID=546274 RepID=C0DXW7_EIKCO|nr:hypothetical protein EIKCOROL_02230 [Eikenella corrodens ATCC 23834]
MIFSVLHSFLGRAFMLDISLLQGAFLSGMNAQSTLYLIFPFKNFPVVPFSLSLEINLALNSKFLLIRTINSYSKLPFFFTTTWLCCFKGDMVFTSTSFPLMKPSEPSWLTSLCLFNPYSNSA